MTEITIVGNLTADPELRYTPNGVAVANFNVAVTSRHFDKDKKEYVDGTTSFYRVSVWRKLAENVAASLKKGQQVIVSGKVEIETYEVAVEGNAPEKRTQVVVTAEHVGPSLRFGTATFTKSSNGGQGQFTGGQYGQAVQTQQQVAAQDATQQANQQQPAAQQQYQQQPAAQQVPAANGLTF